MKALGGRLEWQRKVRKGEYRPETSQTAAGDAIQVKRWYPISVDEMAVRMEKILTDRENEAKKAAEEAALKAQGENNGEEKTGESQEAVSQPSTNG